jgi:hypothetical protein
MLEVEESHSNPLCTLYNYLTLHKITIDDMELYLGTIFTMHLGRLNLKVLRASPTGP